MIRNYDIMEVMIELETMVWIQYYLIRNNI